MFGRCLRSPWCSISLLVALLTSVTLHLARGREERVVHVVATQVDGDETRPRVRIDFDAPMTTVERVGVPLPAGAVALDPAAAVDARFETPRRLLLVPTEPLPRLRAWRVRFGASFAAVDGRPVARADAPTLRSGTFALVGDPSARIAPDGRPVWSTHWSGELAEGALRDATRVVDGAGRPVAFRWTGEGRGWTLVLDAIPEGAVAVEVAAGLRSREGGDPLGQAVRRRVAWSKDLLLTEVDAQADGPASRITLAFSHPLAAQDLAGLVTLAPTPPDLVVRASDGGVACIGTFAPGTTILVTARGALRSTAGLRLGRDVRRVVRMPVPSPSLAILGSGSTLSTAAMPTLEVAGVDVAEMVVELYRVPPGNVVPLALRWRGAQALAVEPVVRRIPVVATPHERWTRTLDLAELLGAPLRGVWQVRVFDAADRWRGETRLLQATDLAPVVRVQRDGLVVSVAGLADGRAVAGARVVAWTSSQRVACEGVTDAQGLFVARGMALAPRVVVVTTGDDLGYVDLDEHRVAHDPREVEGRPVPVDFDAWVRTDRGLVRPGETIHVDAIVRTATGDAPTEGLPATWVLRGPDRRVLRTLERRMPATGFLDADLSIGADAPTGTYAVELRVGVAHPFAGRADVRVEAFVPDRIEATLALPAGALALGGHLALPVKVRLLSGDPAVGRTVRLSLHAAPTPYAPVAGFVFGDADDAPDEVRRDVGEATTGDDGVATFALDLPPVPRGGGALHATLAAEVVDTNGRAIVVRAEADLLPPGAALGVALPTGETLATDVVLVGAGAGGAPSRARVTLERLVVDGAWTRGRRGELTWSSTELAQKLATKDVDLAGGRGRVAFDDPGEGTFRVRAGAEGATPASTRFAWPQGRAGAGADAPDPARLRVRIEGDVRPSAPLALAIDAPFAGRALVTVEGIDALEARVVDLPQGRTQLEVPLGDVHGASVHATATLVRGARVAAAGPVRLLAAAAGQVVRPARRVDVRADVPDVALPGAPLVVHLATSAPADVRVHLVDVAILARTAHGDADPLRFFGAVRRLETRSGDAYAALVAGQRFRPLDPEPGGDGDDGGLAARFDGGVRAVVETVVLASARIAVDGTADVTFPIPAHEGRLRLVVVAASRDGTGAAARDVIVRGPVGLAIVAPLAVAPGDAFDVVVETRGERVTTDVVLDGLTRAEGAPLRVRADDRVGLASVTVRARDAAGHEVTRTARVAVRPAAPYEVAHAVRTVAAGERVAGPLPGDLVPSTRRARVTVGTGPAIAWQPALDRLRDYPHGCVEQTTSRAFPLLALAAASRGGAADGGDDDPIVVGQAIERLLSMQTSSGALAAWPGGDEAYEAGTTYAAHFLVEAGRAGYAVPADRLDAVLDHLENRLRQGAGGAYEAYVVALAGRTGGAWLDVLVERATGEEDRARLACAFVRRGDRDAAKAMLAPVEARPVPAPIDEASGTSTETPTPEVPARATDADPILALLAAARPPSPAAPRSAEPSLASPLRTDALVLEALDDAMPDDARIPALVARLTGALADAHRTTQEDATILLALVHHDARVRGAAPPAHGRLVVGGREVAFRGGAELELAPGDPWTWSVEADGPITVVVRTEGVPRTVDDRAVAQGMAIARRFEVADAKAPGGFAPVDGPLVLGRTYRVVVEGAVPQGAAQLLVTDVLAGGLAVEEARAEDGTLRPDRIEVRDDRVLFFRTAALDGKFRQTYTVRATTVGTFRLPAVRAELLYDATVFARGAGAALEVRR